MKAAKKFLRVLLRRFGGGKPPGVRRLDGPGHLAGGSFEGANSVGRGVSMQGDIRVGYASTISHNCELRGKVSIGRYVQLGPSILVVARDHPKTNLSNYVNNLLFEGALKTLQVDDPVRIGNDAWIGGHATILKGVEIGHGAVVGGGSVVTRSIPPYAIAVGVPAKVVGHRFGEAVIQALLKLEWWNYPPESLARIQDSFFVNLQELPEAEALALLARTADTLSTLPRIADGA